MDFDFLDGLDIRDATEEGLEQYTELAIKISQAKEDPQGYIEKNYNVVNRFEYNGEEYLTIRYKGILAHVSGNKIMEKFDIIDEFTDETYYKDTTIEKIQKMCKTLKQLLKTNKLKHVDTKGDGIKFFGRTDILDLIEESFYKKRMRSVILVGKAGCGKTKIVQRLASKLRNKYVFLEKGGHAIESGKEDAVISMLEKIYQLPHGIKSLDENIYVPFLSSSTGIKFPGLFFSST